jgi:hypothetical protein
LYFHILQIQIDSPARLKDYGGLICKALLTRVAKLIKIIYLARQTKIRVIFKVVQTASLSELKGVGKPRDRLFHRAAHNLKNPLDGIKKHKTLRAQVVREISRNRKVQSADKTVRIYCRRIRVNNRNQRNKIKEIKL